jgi:hypothetical protein
MTSTNLHLISVNVSKQQQIGRYSNAVCCGKSGSFALILRECLLRSQTGVQAKYLKETKERFQLPMAVMPLLETEIKGFAMVERMAEELLTPLSTATGA